MSTKPEWQFPPRNGGIDFVQDPSSAHFSDDPIPKLVREIIQNSLDARESGISDPVVVKFADTEVERELIGASQLYKHLTACLDRAKSEKMPQDVRKVYEKARNALKGKRIRCLRITDSGTTGLSDSNWDALVTREGDVQKSSVGAGGSYGIGKNAVFNVSDAQTVFYSTRYVNGREGRVEKMQGKATLMAHQDPEPASDVPLVGTRRGGGGELQHIGFYRASNGDPFFTTAIPAFFRLDETGTGVFIMGFNPLSSDWVDAVTSAVIENFFYAIHHKQLIIEISSKSKNVLVTHETIDQLFEGKSKPNAYHYYRAIRDEEAEQTAEKIDQVGKLDVYLTIGSGLPNRVAYVNRNGMLVTDSKEQRYNPMAPRRNGLWPDYAAVVLPSTDEGDKWVRGMENPSHDHISSEQLLEIDAKREAGRVFKEVRDSIRRIIDKKVQLDQYGDRSNLYELAEMFPEDFDPSASGNRELRVEEVAPRLITPGPPGPEPGPGTESSPSPGPGRGTDSGPNPPAPGPSPSPRPTRAPRLDNPRFIPVGQREAVIAFAMSEGDLQDKVRVALTPTGGEYYRESQIEIVEATVLNPGEHDLSIENGIVSVTPKPDERLAIRVTTRDRIDNLAFKIG